MMHEPQPRALETAVATRVTLLPGVVLASVLLCMYGGLALTVDFPRAAIGIQSDEATYYMMGHSLAEDGDLTYRREDLVRVWREFPSGPTGLFLKKGRDIVQAGLMLRPPFFWTTTRSDPDPTRYFYGKSFVYPLAAAPFVRLFGTNGFLVLNALLLTLAAFCGYVFLQARMRPVIAAILAGAFVMASVVPVYYVWIAPELFNFTLGLVAYFCWLYKEVAAAPAASRGAGGCSARAAISSPRCCSAWRPSRRCRTRCCFRRSFCGCSGAGAGTARSRRRWCSAWWRPACSV